MEFVKTKGKGPKRIKVDMLDPVMGPGSARTAVAPITVSPSGLNCEAELFLGPDEATKVATSGLVAFTSTGAAQSVSFPVTMPSPGGFAYHVYLDVFANGFPIVAYVATEDVIIPAGTVGPITWE
ncbi:unnamed protein product [marine sediment metagenome]|uniref:Uncharacterized protein n=1 Tax=marine sediment metagenome TaxID=412755 RepID=X1SUX6_9ZZZZ